MHALNGVGSVIAAMSSPCMESTEESDHQVASPGKKTFTFCLFKDIVDRDKILQGQCLVNQRVSIFIEEWSPHIPVRKHAF